MRKAFGLLTLLLLLGSPLWAQSTGPALPPRPVAPVDSGAVLLFNGWYLPSYRPGTGADTTGALLSLFRKRRQARWLYFVPYMVGMSLALPISSTGSNGQKVVAEKAISPPLGVAVLAAAVAGFGVNIATYSKNRLLAVDQAYAAGQPIPAKYRRRLGPQHFAEAAYLRQALAQQMERERRLPPPASSDD